MEFTARDSNVGKERKRKILREISGPVKGNGVWRVHNNKEWMDVNTEPDDISEIRKVRLRWVWHEERVPEERSVKKVLKNIPEGKTSVGKPRKIWLDDVENDMKKWC